MTKLISTFLFAQVLLGGQPLVRDGEKRDAPRKMTLRIYDHANLDSGVMQRAQRQTERIFEQFGVETAWLHCPTSPEQLASNRACAGRLQPNDLVLKILPSEMSKRFGFKRGIFGFALPTAVGTPGNNISLFFARVQDLAYYGGVGRGYENAQAIILGHMMAHEIGHLLLGPDSHSSKGVMNFPWDKRVLQDMERGRLKFTTKEQARIHAELERRWALYLTSTR